MIREFQEEIGFAPQKAKLHSLAQIITSGKFNNKHYQNTTYLYSYLLADNEQVMPGDDITDLHVITQEELQDLINHYYSLGKDDWLLEKGSKIHCWYDYGQMYGFIHQVALDLTG